jgi:hypothetical protein
MREKRHFNFSTVPVRRADRGQALIEFSLTLPIFVLLLIGLVFFAQAFQLQQVLNGAAREGARAWARNPPGGSWTQCDDPLCTRDPNRVTVNAPTQNFVYYIEPVVREYISKNGFSPDTVTFFTSDKAQEKSKISEIVQQLDAQNEQVEITLYYPIALPLGNLSEYTLVHLRASCVLKRG